MNKRTTLSDILDIVSEYRRVSIEQLRSTSRVRLIAWPRQEFMFLAYVHSQFSCPQIGNRIFRDHTTVLHGVNVVKNRLKQPWYRDEIEQMENELSVFGVPRFYRHGALDFPTVRATNV